MLQRYKKMAGGAIEEDSVEGKPAFRLKGDGDLHLRWTLRGQHFIVAWGGETPSAIAQRMAGEEPQWFAAIARDLPVERRAALVHVDCETLFSRNAEMRAKAKQTGFHHLRSFTLVTGLDREDFVSRVLLEADGKTAARWQDLVARPLKLDDLAVVPRDATLALAVNVETSRLLACLARLQKA